MAQKSNNYNAKNLLGQKFQRLLVLDYADKPSHIKGRSQYWKCQCDCGKIINVATQSLTWHKTQSCGCFHKEKISKPKNVARINRIFEQYKRSAIKRKLKFDLSREDVENLVLDKCNYCHALPKEKILNGIDRVINEQGYLKNNVVPCCVICNRMKQILSVDDFLAHIRKIIEIYEANKNTGN